MKPKTIISRPVELSLYIIGVWPDSSYAILHRVTWAIAMTTCLTFQYWYFFIYGKSEELPDLLDAISVTVSNTLVFLKLIIIWLNSRTFHDIMTVLSEDWDNYASTDWNARAMTSKAVLSARFSNCMVGLYSMTVILCAATVMLGPEDTTENYNPKEKKMIIQMYFPFDATISPIYEIILITQFLMESFAALMAGMMMALVATLILHVGSQIDIMCGELNEISVHYENEESSKTVLKNLVFRHRRILRLSDNIEYVFSYISLAQFLSNILVICFLGFLVATSLDSEQGSTILVRCLPYYICVNFEAFVLCITGEYLSSKSENISQAVYDSNWYKLRPRERRIISLLILRSQKQLTLTAGKFVNLSLETFASMLKASASYISVLHAMY